MTCYIQCGKARSECTNAYRPTIHCGNNISGKISIVSALIFMRLCVPQEMAKFLDVDFINDEVERDLPFVK